MIKDDLRERHRKQVMDLEADLARIQRLRDAGPMMLSALKVAYQVMSCVGAAEKYVIADAIHAVEPEWSP